MLQLWTCAKCGRQFSSGKISLPVRCACRYIDSTGETIVETAGHVPPVASKKSRSRGFGDTVAWITNALGIPQCGNCKERQEALNKIFPYSPEYVAEQDAAKSVDLGGRPGEPRK